MMMGTHLIISQNIIDSLDENTKNLINEKNFKYGNIKPDIVSKYKLKKHYLEESYDMIEEKVKNLSEMNPDSLAKIFNSISFNQELGVICHFLCDFFCVAHSERWEFKHSFIQHVTYERDLNHCSKDFSFNLDRHQIRNSFENFFRDLYEEYKTCSKSQENDLKFAAYVCKSVINYILDRIFKRNDSRTFVLMPAY